jgi:hypothetical protein
MSELNVNNIKSMYPEGTKLKILKINDESLGVPEGTIATVNYVDSIGTIHCTWGDRKTVSLLPNADTLTIVDEVVDISFPSAETEYREMELLFSDLTPDAQARYLATFRAEDPADEVILENLPIINLSPSNVGYGVQYVLLPVKNKDALTESTGHDIFSTRPLPDVLKHIGHDLTLITDNAGRRTPTMAAIVCRRCNDVLMSMKLDPTTFTPPSSDTLESLVINTDISKLTDVVKYNLCAQFDDIAYKLRLAYEDGLDTEKDLTEQIEWWELLSNIMNAGPQPYPLENL